MRRKAKSSDITTNQTLHSYISYFTATIIITLMNTFTNVCYHWIYSPYIQMQEKIVSDREWLKFDVEWNSIHMPLLMIKNNDFAIDTDNFSKEQYRNSNISCSNVRSFVLSSFASELTMTNWKIPSLDTLVFCERKANKNKLFLILYSLFIKNL